MLTDEVLRVENFKHKNFLRLGCSTYTAQLLIELGVDWHELEELIDAGCPLEVALDILKPV